MADRGKLNPALGAGAGSTIAAGVYALVADGVSVYAAGSFQTAGGVAASNIARWDGSGWSALGSGVDSYVEVMTMAGTTLYLGGGFLVAGGKASPYLARTNLDPLFTGAIGIAVPAGSVIHVKEEVGEVIIPIVRTGGSTGSIGFTVSTTNGSAVVNSDFTAPPSAQSMADGVTSLNITIPITTGDAAEPNETFNVTLSAPTGGATLGPVKSVTVRIIDPEDSTDPTAPTISTPAEGSLVNPSTGDLITVTGTAKDDKGVSSVMVQLNTGSFIEAILSSPGAATTTYTAVVGGTVGGANFIKVKSIDTRANESPVVTRSFRVPRQLLVNLDDSLGSVSPGFVGASLREVARSYTITATPKSTPAPGGVFTGWTLGGQDVANGNAPFTPQRLGAAASSLNKQTLTFIFREGLELTANFIANPYPSLAGTYNGHIRPSDTQPAPNGTTRDNSTEGHFTATVQSTGAFSGKLTIDGLVLNVAGTFDHNGVARFGTARLPTLTVARTGKPSLSVALQLNIAENQSDPAVDDKITGTVTATDFKRSAVTAVSEVDADRAFYNGTSAIVPAAYLGASNANGVFTAVLPAKDAGDQPAGLTEQDYPQGDGIATVTITKAGVVTVTGTLADGTAVTASSTLSEVGAGHASRFPLFASLYTKKGFLSGFVSLDSTQSASDMAAANVLWLRPFISTSHYYPYGWPEVIVVDLMGAKYVVTTGQSSLKAPDGADEDDLGDPLQGADEDGNTTLSFSEGQLSEALLKFVNVSITDAVTKVPDNDPTFTLTITRATGAIGGTFTHTDDTVAAFKGILYQKGAGATAGGHGYFLTKQPTPIDYTGESGRVRIIGFAS